MKRLALGLVVIVVVLVAGVVFAPFFVDLDPYKARIAAEISKATGREVAIDGAIALEILPQPHVSITGVRLGNIEGAAAPDMAEVAALDASLALGPLLGGDVQVTSITLIRPIVTLERLADGRANWEFPTSGGGEATSVRFDQVAIEDGTFILRDETTGQTFQADAVELEATAQSLAGPFEIDGQAVIAGLALGIEARLGALDRPSTPVGVQLDVGTGRLAFDGTLTGLDGAPAAAGRVEASGESLARLLEAVGVALGPTGAMADYPFAASAEIKGDAGSVALGGLVATVGETRLTGAFDIVPGTPLRIDGVVAVNRIDLDALLAALPVTAPAEAAPTASLVPTGIAGDLSVGVDALVVKGEIVQQVRLDVAVEDGVVALQQGTAQLPG
ncbi:MAG: AsmA family protein, partial [Alphaproteobacteria bacterium]